MITIPEAEQLQLQLAKKVIIDNTFSSNVSVVAGCDVEYDKGSDLIAGSISLLNINTLEVIETSTYCMAAEFPYVPGLFSFREMPVILKAFEKLELKPEVIICDGHGLAHPRRFGLACHLGVSLDIPTIGCGKTCLFGKYGVVGIERGSNTDLIDDVTNEVIGKVLRTQNGINPVFVSVGHKVSLEAACKIVLQLATTYRLPETTRVADAYARETLIKCKAEHKSGPEDINHTSS